MKKDNYEDIIGLPHNVSDHHLPMPMDKRAAQFSPFAALKGYEDAISETGRFTSERRQITEDVQEDMSRQLNALDRILNETPSSRPAVRLTYYMPDTRKAGGSVRTTAGRLKKIDSVHRILVLDTGEELPMDDICDLQIIRCEEL